MTHSHPLPDNTALCPSCRTPMTPCCERIAQLRAKKAKKARDRRIPKPTRVNRTYADLQESWGKSRLPNPKINPDPIGPA